MQTNDLFGEAKRTRLRRMESVRADVLKLKGKLAQAATCAHVK